MTFDAPFWALVALILFFALIVYMKVPRTINSSLDARAEGIRKELDEAKRLRIEAEALLAEYKKKAASAEADAREIVEQAKREAAALAAEARQRTEDYVAGRTKLAADKIAQAEHQAVQEVRALSADVAIAAASQILAARVKGAEGEALLAKAIGDVKAKLH